MSAKIKKYTNNFYEGIAGVSASTAEVVTKFLYHHVRPSSVIDVGCGKGQYLKCFAELGVAKVAGVEGPWIRDVSPVVAQELIRVEDLAAESLAQIDLGRFGLLTCIEVAEHLPLSSSKGFVDLLTRTSPVIFFSAAVPEQGGVHHVNEQRLSFWSEIFQAHGFELFDNARPALWGDTRVDPCVRQNGVVFVDRKWTGGLLFQGMPSFLGADLVHPDLFEASTRRWRDDDFLGGILAGRNLRMLFSTAIGNRIRGRIAGSRA